MTVTTPRTEFVAGATGYTGSALVQELRSRSIETIAHVRPDSPTLPQWRERFEAAGAVVDTTPWEEDALAATLARTQPSVVFALLGTTRARMRKAGGADSYESVDYGLTAMLLRAVMRSAPNARFVYLSSAGVGPSAHGEYLRVRWRLEQELRASGVPWVIARPAFITGSDREESRPLERVLGSAIDFVLSVAGAVGGPRVRDRYSSLSAGELARGLGRLGVENGWEGRVVF
ncbi:MAG TPA: NAD(P)H-binding protein, partial [Longimicrobiales bacterium]|nr:NAD(P)H-binding protein [Longimicrobiales bacterium]